MPDRREFFRQTATLAVGLAARDAAAASGQQGAATMPTPRASAVMGLLGLKYPIFCAGMASAASPELAIAVSNAGGLGAVGTGAALPAAAVRERVSRIKSGTSRSFAVDYLLAFDPVTVPVALDAGAPIVQFAWGIPSIDTVGTIRRAGAKMGVQIGSAAGAKAALDAGADYLICQGIVE